MAPPPMNGTKRAKLLIGGSWIEGASTVDVVDKFSGKPIGLVDCASHAQIDAAVAAAKKSFETTKLDAQTRYQILSKASQLIEQRRGEIIQTIVAEAGFPVSIADN